MNDDAYTLAWGETVRLRDNLRQLDGLDRRLAALVLSGPRPRSPAQRDNHSEIGPVVWDLSLASLGAGMDHMATWRAILDGADRQGGRVPVFAHFTLLRAAAEAAVLTRWLCDPEADHEERLRRGRGAHLADQEERRKLEDLWLRARGAGAADAAKGIPAMRQAPKRSSVTPRAVPSVTELFAAYATLPSPLFRAGNGEALFRMLSGIAHGKPWALEALSRFNGTVPSAGGGTAVRIIDLAQASWASFATIVTLGGAIDDVERYASAV